MSTRKEEIKKLIIERLNLKIQIEEFRDEAPLFSAKEDGGIGLDSVDALEIAVGIMNDYEIEITDEDMHIFESVNSIDKFIEERQNS